MNKIVEGSGEFEFSSGWKKMIKDNRKDIFSEEFRVKIEDLQLKLESLNSSITNLAEKETVKEKLPTSDISLEQMILSKIENLEVSIIQIEGAIEALEKEIIHNKNLMDNQNFLLSEIIDLIKNKENTDGSSQTGFIANIFKKK